MSSPGPIVANLELAAFLAAARKTGQFTNDSLERARQAGNNFAASMDRITTQAGESPAGIAAISQAILSLDSA